MKKGFLLFLTVLLSLSVTLKAQTIVLNESFEDGIPSTWTQENVVGEQMWAVEENGTTPDGAFEGTHRLYLRNDKGQTLGYKTRLISPVMNLAGVYQPIIKFAYAQPKWTGDVDTLRIWYKSAYKDEWHLMDQLAEPQETWKIYSSDLPAVSDAYQLAFEGVDNLGHGIMIDDIWVRSKPECTVPHDLYVTSMRDFAATLGWQASLDANYFQIVLTESDKTQLTGMIDPDTLDRMDPKDIAFNIQVDADSFTYRISGLEAGMYYHVYVRSLCDAENSEWGHTFFRMNAAVPLPYMETFSVDYIGQASRLAAWTFGNNTNTYTPFISSNMAPGPDLAPYSPDSSMCMMFTGANNATTLIPANRFVYAVTPELQGADLKNCQVRFFGGVAGYTGMRNYACGIIVGVMTEPEDMNTFVPIDTCRVWGCMEFNEFCISLEKYAGTGKYICFMSSFDRINNFYIDNVTVEVRPNIQRVYEISVAPKDTCATIQWKGAATTYDVMITNAKISSFNNIPAEIIVKRETVNGNSMYVSGLLPFRSWNNPYYVYIRAAAGSDFSEWSSPKQFVTTAACNEIPMSFTFEDDAESYIVPKAGLCPGKINVFGNNASISSTVHAYPYMIKSNAYKGSYALTATNAFGCDEWVTLPRMKEDILRESELTFYLSGSSSYSSTRVAVGLMTNPMDLSTFTQMAVYTLSSSNYVREYIEFSDPTLNGKGEYIAFVWLDNARGQNVAYIDNITVDNINNCQPPAGFSAQISDQSATVTWNKVGEEWELVLSNAFLTETVLDAPDWYTAESIVSIDTVRNTPSIELTGLEAAHSYYLYARTLCNGGNRSIWSSPFTIETDCAKKITFGYSETFSNYGSGTSAYPRCWSGDFEWTYTTTGYQLPYVHASNDHTGDHIGSAYMYSSTVASSCLISPEIEGDMSRMCISFYYFASNTGYTMYVGMIDNVNDYTTFQPLDTVRTVANTWKQATLDLSKYKGTAKHLAFSCYGAGSSIVYLDDILIKDMACARPFNLHGENITDNSMTVTWSGLTTDKFEVYVTDKEMHILNESLGDVPAVNTIVHEFVSGNSLFIDNLNTYTKYYLYVRPTCGEQLWGSGTARTECFVINPKTNYRENFDNYVSGQGYAPDCWTVGNMGSTSTTYIPYIHSVSSAASSAPNVLHISASVSGTTLYGPAYAIAPKIQTSDISQVSIGFTACASSAVGISAIFGMVSDPEDMTTFVTIDSISMSGAPVTFSYDLSEYANIIGDARYAAWRTSYGTGSQTFYLDDVIITGSSCPVPNPSVSQITSSEVYLSSGLRVSIPWKLIVTDTPLPLDSLSSDTYTIPSDVTIIKQITNSSDVRRYKLENLPENTTFYCYLSSSCENNESSLWKVVSFSTICNPITLEAFGSIGFEPEEGYRYAYDEGGSDFGCWIVGNKSSKNSSDIPSINKTTGASAHTGVNSLKISSTPSMNGAYAITPAIAVDSINRLQINFYGYSGTSTSSDHRIIVGVVTDPSDMSTFTAVDTVNAYGTECIAFTVSMADYEGDYMGDLGKHICFLSEFELSNTFYLDDVSLEYIPTCSKPLYLKLDSVSEHTAIISWEGESERYRVAIAKDFIPENICDGYTSYVIDTIVSGKSVTIENLQGGTQYFPFVQALCGNEHSVFSTERLPINTDCAERMKVPYFCDFDHNASIDVVPDCWIGLVSNNAPQTYPQINYRSGKGDSYGLELLSNGASRSLCYALLPDFEIESLGDYMLSFDARKAQDVEACGGDLVIGYVRDVKNIESTFVALDTVRIKDDTFHKYHVDMRAYGDRLIGMTRLALVANYRIANTAFEDIYLDNISVDVPMNCISPELSIASGDLTSVTFNILPASANAASYRVAVVSYDDYVNQTDWTAVSGLAKMVDTNELSATVIGLTAGTHYVALVQSVCGTTDGSSNWSEPIDVFTATDYKDTYFFGFERNEGWVKSINAKVDDWYIHPSLVTGLMDGNRYADYTQYPYSLNNDKLCIYSHSGEGALRMQNVGAYVIFPYLSEPKNRSLSFDIRTSYTSRVSKRLMTATDKGGFILGLVEKDKGIETFEPLFSDKLQRLSTLTEANEGNNNMFIHYVVNLTAEQLTNKQLVIVNNSRGDVMTYMDNVSMGAPSVWTTPIITSLLFGDTYADLKWINNEVMDIYVMDGLNKPLDKTKAVVTVNNVVGGTYHVTGLQPETEYTLYLCTTTAPSVITTSRSFTTPCSAVQLNSAGKVTFNFDNDIYKPYPDALSSDTLYWYPQCWIMGNSETDKSVYTYKKPLVQLPGRSITNSPMAGGTYSLYVPGRANSNALRFHSNDDYVTYAAMPLIDAGLDSMQLEFYCRSFVHNISTNMIVSNTLMTTPYNEVIIGTMSDPTDYNTFEPIDTVSYPYFENMSDQTALVDDPAHEDWWYKAIVPLKNAKANYIAFACYKLGMMLIDDVCLTPQSGILPPSGLNEYEVGTRTAKVRWNNVWQPEMKTIIHLYAADQTTVVKCDTLESDVKNYTFTNLGLSTKYYWTLQQFGVEGTTAETPKRTFTTECETIDITYSTSFEVADGEQEMIPGMKKTSCWTYTNLGTITTVSTKYPSNYGPTVAHTGNNGVRLYRSAATIRGAVCSPMFEDYAQLDSMQLVFWARPGVHDVSTGTITTVYNTGLQAATAIEIGTCSDPDDIKTYVPIAQVDYSDTRLVKGATVNAENDYLFQRFSIPLKGAVGPYVYIACPEKATNGKKITAQNMFIDDVSFTRFVPCATPERPTQIFRSIDSIACTWESEVGSYVVELSTSSEFTDATTISMDVVGDTCGFGGLQPNTTYYCRVSAACSAKDISECSLTGIFATAVTPSYLEDFRARETKDRWFTGTTCAKDVFENNAPVTGEALASYGWHRITDKVGLESAHICAPFHSSTAPTFNYYWYLMPQMYLPVTGKNIHLTFEYALTQMMDATVSPHPVTANNIDNSFTFMVVISDDGGKTWKRENATVWSEGTNYGQPDYALTSIPNKNGQMFIDLTKYEGKYIQIGFYREAQKHLNPGAGIHVGRVRVNYFDNQKDERDLCQYESAYAFNRFYVDGDNVQTGTQQFMEYSLAPEKEMNIHGVGMLDTVYSFIAHFTAAEKTSFADTICEGTSYSIPGFIQHDKAGVYRLKLTSAVTGCDSIVTLNLGVTPTVRYNEEAILCPGETFEWNGRILNRSGLYRDTTISYVTGCDSISSLVLTYLNAGDTLTKEVIITEDDLPYSYESITYPVGTKPGVYIDTIYVESGECKGMLIHKLTINAGTELEEILDMNTLQSGVHKLIIREQLYIVRDGEWYDALGNPENCPL